MYISHKQATSASFTPNQTEKCGLDNPNFKIDDEKTKKVAFAIGDIANLHVCS